VGTAQPGEEDALTVVRVDDVRRTRWAYVELTEFFPRAKSMDDEQLHLICGDPHR
jgi:hypothetical protein